MQSGGAEGQAPDFARNLEFLAVPVIDAAADAARRRSLEQRVPSPRDAATNGGFTCGRQALARGTA